MSDLNEVHLIGRVGRRGIAIKYTATGKAVAKFSVETRASYYDYERHSTEYHNVVAWQEEAIMIQGLKVGDSIEVFGRLTTRKWEKDGITRYTTEVVAREILIGGNRNDVQCGSREVTRAVPGVEQGPTRGNTEDMGTRNQTVDAATITDDDIPF
jgi:single-strand DNA-binding protein